MSTSSVESAAPTSSGTPSASRAPSSFGAPKPSAALGAPRLRRCIVGALSLSAAAALTIGIVTAAAPASAAGSASAASASAAPAPATSFVAMATVTALTTATITPVATSTPAPSDSGWTKLRADLKAARALPQGQRRAAVVSIQTKALAGDYGSTVKDDLVKAEDYVKGLPKGTRREIMRLIAAGLQRKAAAAPSSTSTPTPAPGARISSQSGVRTAAA